MSNANTISTNFAMRFFVRILPDRMKRIIYLTSLTAIAKQTNVPEKELIRKLNHVLHLSSTGDAALKLPIHLSRLIWADKVVFRQDIEKLAVCEDEEVHACAERIVEATPKWFSYGKPNELLNDIVALFRKDNKIFENKALN